MKNEEKKSGKQNANEQIITQSPSETSDKPWRTHTGTLLLWNGK